MLSYLYVIFIGEG